MIYSTDAVIDAYRRNIVSSFLLFDEDSNSVEEKVRILKEDMPKFACVFTKRQVEILRYIYKDYLELTSEGLYGYIGLSESSLDTMLALHPHLGEEYVESFTYQPLPTILILKYLKTLHKICVSKELGVTMDKIK